MPDGYDIYHAPFLAALAEWAYQQGLRPKVAERLAAGFAGHPFSIWDGEVTEINSGNYITIERNNGELTYAQIPTGYSNSLVSVGTTVEAFEPLTTDTVVDVAIEGTEEVAWGEPIRCTSTSDGALNLDSVPQDMLPVVALKLHLLDEDRTEEHLTKRLDGTTLYLAERVSFSGEGYIQLLDQPPRNITGLTVEADTTNDQLSVVRKMILEVFSHTGLLKTATL
jgi:hypothetical protein